ncbi:hypothetical protein V9U70_02185 [Streptomyces pratensis]
MQSVRWLTAARALGFLYLRSLHKRAHDRHRVRAKVKPLAVAALIAEPAMKFGLHDGAAFEDRK